MSSNIQFFKTRLNVDCCGQHPAFHKNWMLIVAVNIRCFPQKLNVDLHSLGANNVGKRCANITGAPPFIVQVHMFCQTEVPHEAVLYSIVDAWLGSASLP